MEGKLLECGNGEFQVNALCFHINSWFALKSLKNNSLKNSGGTGGNYQVARLPFHNKVLVLPSDHVTGIHSGYSRCPILLLLQTPV